MLLACHQITKSFGEQRILSEGSFHIEDHEKAALVGPNGAGKSTLLKILTGEISADSGSVILAKGKTLGYLSQHQAMESRATIYQEVRLAKAHIFQLEETIRTVEQELKHLSGSALQDRLEHYHRLVESFERQNGYACESEITGVLKGLGFSEEEFEKPVASLSGGQKTRVALGKLLLSKPDLLLLDEPTNHLDLDSVVWLESYLSGCPGAVLIVSHDRYFLNRTVSKIIDLDHGSLSVYSGNYDLYAAKKRDRIEARKKEYLKQQQEIKHQEAVIEKLRSFNREKSIKRAESREKLLDRITPLEKPADPSASMHLKLEPSILSGNDVLTVSGLTKAYPSQPLFADVDFQIKRGEHVAVIGGNGTGKTTLLKILNRVVEADRGEFLLGSQVKIGYYDQEHHVLHMDKTVFEEISDTYPSLTGTKIRNVLAAFLFTGDDVFKQISALSGGERGRVSLAKLMLSEANFLILDEPTNHLDITSKEILEQALNDYTGTLLFVSHDRYFINQTASRILELSDGSFHNYLGNYDYYLEKKAQQSSALEQSSSSASSSPASSSGSRLSWQEQKELQARERKRQNDLQKTESAIMELEARCEEIDHLMTLEENFTNSVLCQELATEHASLQEQLEALYVRWEELEEASL